jgi:soluble lytic murein transglycosylase
MGGFSLIFAVSKKIRILFTFILILIMFFLAFHSVQWAVKTVFPMHYKDLIVKYAEMNNVDPLLVAAIIRNESKFNPEAISKREAKGLMQIAPVTGHWASERLNIENYSEDMLFEPELNIRIGCWYLNVLNNEFNHNLELVIAAYNAGNGNVTKWLNNKEYSSNGDKLDRIPFEETRIYLIKVMRDYKIYQRIYGS